MTVDTSIDSGTTGDVPQRLVANRRQTRALASFIGEARTPLRARRLALRISEAVAALHAGESAHASTKDHSRVHGALSPSVLSIDTRDRVAFSAPDEPLSTLARLRYASPEVARGEAPTAASDVFSLALIVRELLEGEPVRRGLGDETAIDAVDGRVSVPRGLTGELRELALISTGLHADQRPEASEWVRALARVGRARLWSRSKRILFAAAASGVVLLAVVLRTSVRAHDQTEQHFQGARDVIHGLLAGTYHELDRVENIGPLAAAGARALVDLERVDAADRSAADHELLARMLLWNGEAQRVAGNLDEARSLLVRAADCSATVEDRRVSATIELHAVTSLGEMARAERDLDAARDHFQRALELGEARFAAGETDRDLRIAFAHTLIRYGDLSRSTGKQSARRVRQIYRKARAVLDGPDVGRSDVGGAGPDRRTRDREALELIAELDRLEATMAWQSGDSELAIKLLCSRVARVERLIEMDPGLPRRRQMLADATSSLAGAQRQTGELQQGVESLRRAVEALRLLREMEPDKLQWRRDWGRTVRNLAGALGDVGEWQESAELHDISVAVIEGLLKNDGAAATTRFEVAVQLLDAGKGQLEAGNLQRARDRWERAGKWLGKRAKGKRSARTWAHIRARSRVLEAELLLAEGHWVAAEDHALDFMAVLHLSSGQESTGAGRAPQLRREHARALLVVSAVRAMDGDVVVARDTRERALAITDELLAERPIHPDVMALKTQVLFTLGRDRQAAKMLRELDAIGYAGIELNAIRATLSALRR